MPVSSRATEERSTEGRHPSVLCLGTNATRMARPGYRELGECLKSQASPGTHPQIVIHPWRSPPLGPPASVIQLRKATIQRWGGETAEGDCARSGGEHEQWPQPSFPAVLVASNGPSTAGANLERQRAQQGFPFRQASGRPRKPPLRAAPREIVKRLGTAGMRMGYSPRQEPTPQPGSDPPNLGVGAAQQNKSSAVKKSKATAAAHGPSESK